MEARDRKWHTRLQHLEQVEVGVYLVFRSNLAELADVEQQA